MPSTQRKIKSRKLATPTAAVTVVTAALLLLAVLGGTQANAQTSITWANTGSNFADGANWVGGNAPTTNTTNAWNIGIFTNGTVANNPVLTADRSIGGLGFLPGTAAMTVNGSGGTWILNVGVRGISNYSGNTQTFGTGLQLTIPTNPPAGQVQFVAESGRLVIDSSLQTVSGTTIVLNGASGGTISGSISGPGSLQKPNGATAWTLAGSNSGWTGGFSMATGTSELSLILANPDALRMARVTANGSVMSFGSLTNANFGSLGSTIAAVTPFALTNDSGSNVALTIGFNSTNASLNRRIDGGGSVTKVGAGTQNWAASNTYTGNTTVLEGTLSLSNTNALMNSTLDTGPSGAQQVTFVRAGANTYNIGGLAGADALAIGANSLRVGSNNQSTTYTGDMSGTGGLSKIGTGTLTLSGSNTYTGTTTISNGVLQIGDGGTNGTLGTGAVTNQAGLVINRGGTYLVSNNIAGTGGLTNIGAGTVTLAGSNSLTGGTVVSNGTLRMAANAYLDGVTTVTNAGTIAGTGTAGTLNINGGGVLAPGNSAGTLTATNGATWSQGGSYNWEIFDLANNPGTSWDLLDVTAGTLDLTGITTAGGFTINLITLQGDNTTPGALTGFDPTANYNNIWLIARAPTITGFNAANFNLVSGNFVGATGTFTITQQAVGGGQGLYLSYNGGGAVPEPGTWAMAALLLSGAAATIYRRRKAAKKVSAAD
jgi:fibronectin-binding autotransporter adhesin